MFFVTSWFRKCNKIYFSYIEYRKNYWWFLTKNWKCMTKIPLSGFCTRACKLFWKENRFSKFHPMRPSLTTLAKMLKSKKWRFLPKIGIFQNVAKNLQWSPILRISANYAILRKSKIDFFRFHQHEDHSVGNDLSWAEEHFRHRENIFPGVGAKWFFRRN